MGQTAVEIEFDIERQRHALSARVSRLERRVRDDIDFTRTRTSEHIAGVKHTVTSSVEDATRKVGSVAGTSAGSGTAIAGHPKALVVGAAAGGVALGLASGGHDDESERPSEASSKKGRTRSKAPVGGEGGLFRSLTDVARGFVATQAASLAESLVGSAKSSLKSSVSGKRGASTASGTHGDDHPVVAARPPQLRQGEPVVGGPNQPGPVIGGTDRPPSESRSAVLDTFTS